jgi:hypothetical protein
MIVRGQLFRHVWILFGRDASGSLLTRRLDALLHNDGARRFALMARFHGSRRSDSFEIAAATEPLWRE